MNRAYVHQRAYSAVADGLVDGARSVKVGDGFDADVQLGPLNNLPQLERVSGLIGDAIQRGGRREASRRAGYFDAPTILTGADDGMPVVDEEQFGPVLPVIPFRSSNEVVERANAGMYSLTASVWSADVDRAYAVGSELDTGPLLVNAHGSGVRPDLPFGGRRRSGIGVENGPSGPDTDAHIAPAES